MTASHRSLLTIVTLATTATLAASAITPKIPPGYKPELDKDERGLWMEVEEYENQLRSSPLLVQDPEINTYVKDVACRVAGDYCNDMRVYVVRNPGFNASMTANGMMQVWTGLLMRVSTEDELASVLGHELSHYAMAHTLARFRSLRAGMGLGSLVSFGLAVATGVSVPIGEMTAMMASLAFSREQETEADLLGAQFMAEGGYDPHASYRVWETLEQEEEAAAAKSEKPGLFMGTHPGIKERIRDLKAWVPEHYGLPRESAPGDRHRRAVASQYFTFMEDQIDTNRYGRTSFMLDRHASLGVDPALIEFFRGEMYRQRAAEGDTQLAIAAYETSIDTGNPPPEAYRNLGYLRLKAKNTPAAQALFHQYLDARPDASDREMIDFYLAEE